jgi:hypothetical protein
MDEPRMKDMMDPKKLPFDGMRMFWGGFESLVELSAEMSPHPQATGSPKMPDPRVTPSHSSFPRP